jgi:hypothetical protein
LTDDAELEATELEIARIEAMIERLEEQLERDVALDARVDRRAIAARLHKLRAERRQLIDWLDETRLGDEWV